MRSEGRFFVQGNFLFQIKYKIFGMVLVRERTNSWLTISLHVQLMPSDSYSIVVSMSRYAPIEKLVFSENYCSKSLTIVIAKSIWSKNANMNSNKVKNLFRLLSNNSVYIYRKEMIFSFFSPLQFFERRIAQDWFR